MRNIGRADFCDSSPPTFGSGLLFSHPSSPISGTWGDRSHSGGIGLGHHPPPPLPPQSLKLMAGQRPVIYGLGRGRGAKRTESPKQQPPTVRRLRPKPAPKTARREHLGSPVASNKRRYSESLSLGASSPVREDRGFRALQPRLTLSKQPQQPPPSPPPASDKAPSLASPKAVPAVIPRPEELVATDLLVSPKAVPAAIPRPVEQVATDPQQGLSSSLRTVPSPVPRSRPSTQPHWASDGAELIRPLSPVTCGSPLSVTSSPKGGVKVIPPVACPPQEPSSLLSDGQPATDPPTDPPPDPPPCGSRVVRDPRWWQWEDQDGGVGAQGIVVGKASGGWIKVLWANGVQNYYRWGLDGACDVCLDSRRPDPNLASALGRQTLNSSVVSPGGFDVVPVFPHSKSSAGPPPTSRIVLAPQGSPRVAAPYASPPVATPYSNPCSQPVAPAPPPTTPPHPLQYVSVTSSQTLSSDSPPSSLDLSPALHTIPRDSNAWRRDSHVSASSTKQSTPAQPRFAVPDTSSGRWSSAGAGRWVPHGRGPQDHAPRGTWAGAAFHASR
eukprot:Hpha_TRINITY_DN26257_c0_g1::TRINITY_DN26257_c0_g1_i1::g.184660::m.184660